MEHRFWQVAQERVHQKEGGQEKVQAGGKGKSDQAESCPKEVRTEAGCKEAVQAGRKSKSDQEKDCQEDVREEESREEKEIVG